MGLYGNDYIGAFSVSSDSFTILGGSPKQSSRSMIEENLKTKTVETLINGSDLVGIYCVVNSSHMLIPEMAYEPEIKNLEGQLDGVSVSILRSDLNALRNNILANDKIALVNPNYSSADLKLIGEMLDVEAIRMSIGGFETVGANNILTNKGITLNNKVSEAEEDSLKKIFHRVSQSTANLGSLSIGLCTVANSSGLLAGTATTGFEIANIADGLSLE